MFNFCPWSAIIVFCLKRKMNTTKKNRKSKTRSRVQYKSRSSSRKKNLNKMHWRDVAPMSQSSRRKMKQSCFLDEKNLKYPICPKRVNRRTCKGLVTARARAVINGDEHIVSKADRQKKILMCNSASSRKRDAGIINRSLKRTSRSNTQRRQRRHRSQHTKRTATQKKTPSLHHLTKVGAQIKYSKKRINDVDV
jgi:hypothetical protein